MTGLDELEGGSVWDEEIYQAFRSHVEEEDHLLQEYKRLAENESSPDVAYLTSLILDDEKRHHKLFEQLAETVRHVVELVPDAAGVPDVPLRRPGSHSLRTVTEQLLKFEREDLRKLRQLRRSLKPVAETTIWPLIVETMELDTRKHILILKHVLDIAGGIFGD